MEISAPDCLILSVKRPHGSSFSATPTLKTPRIGFTSRACPARTVTDPTARGPAGSGSSSSSASEVSWRVMRSSRGITRSRVARVRAAVLSSAACFAASSAMRCWIRSDSSVTWVVPGREREPARVTPGEEPRHRRGVCRARIRVADLGGDTLHRPLGGLRPGAPDDVREALDLPAPGHDARVWRGGHRCAGDGRPAAQCARRGPRCRRCVSRRVSPSHNSLYGTLAPAPPAACILDDHLLT